MTRTKLQKLMIWSTILWHLSHDNDTENYAKSNDNFPIYHLYIMFIVWPVIWNSRCTQHILPASRSSLLLQCRRAWRGSVIRVILNLQTMVLFKHYFVSWDEHRIESKVVRIGLSNSYSNILQTYFKPSRTKPQLSTHVDLRGPKVPQLALEAHIDTGPTFKEASLPRVRNIGILSWNCLISRQAFLLPLMDTEPRRIRNDHLLGSHTWKIHTWYFQWTHPKRKGTHHFPWKKTAPHSSCSWPKKVVKSQQSGLLSASSTLICRPLPCINPMLTGILWNQCQLCDSDLGHHLEKLKIHHFGPEIPRKSHGHLLQSFTGPPRRTPRAPGHLVGPYNFKAPKRYTSSHGRWCGSCHNPWQNACGKVYRMISGLFIVNHEEKHRMVLARTIWKPLLEQKNSRNNL